MVEQVIKRLNDILNLNDKALQRLLREIPKKDLAYLLLDAGPEVKQKIYNNLSDRYATMLKEDLELITGTDKSNISAAKQKFLSAYNKLIKEGEIIQGKVKKSVKPIKKIECVDYLKEKKSANQQPKR